MYGYSAEFVISWDNTSRVYCWAVSTASGRLLAFFRNAKDAAAYCDSLALQGV